MEFLKRYWSQIRVQTAQMPASTRLLIGSLVIILLLVGFLVLQYTGKPQMVPFTSLAGDRQEEAAAALRQRGIDVVIEGGQMLVPYDQRIDAMAAMESSGMLGPDSSRAFDDVILKSSPWDPSAKTTMAFLQAKQKFLAQVITKMKGVRGADVVISIPQNSGFGRTHVKPSASVNVVMQSGRMNRQLVEAIAGLVSGAVAEMSPREVVVIDAVDGRAHRVGDPDELNSDQLMANLVQIEGRYHQKISDLLRYIPGVIVAVSVRTDTVQHQDIREWKYDPNQPLISERSRTSETTDVRQGGEPGARSNTGADVVAGAGKTGSSTKTEEIETKFGPPALTSEARIKKTGQMAQDVNVTVNVPRSFFVSLFKRGKPADAAEPDDATLQPLVDAHLADIKKQIEPLIKTETGPGLVTAHMILDVGAILAMADGGAAAAAGGVLSIVSAEWFQPAMLASLIAGSLGLMFFMVRKATRIAPIPSAAELAGVPPPITAEEDLLGEVTEHEPAMAGVELAEEEVQVRKVAQQIDELVSEYPTEAATLFKRWVRAEES
jgi:flagellar M-ring protein FliF